MGTREYARGSLGQRAGGEQFNAHLWEDFVCPVVDTRPHPHGQPASRGGDSGGWLDKLLNYRLQVPAHARVTRRSVASRRAVSTDQAKDVHDRARPSAYQVTGVELARRQLCQIEVTLELGIKLRVRFASGVQIDDGVRFDLPLRRRHRSAFEYAVRRDHYLTLDLDSALDQTQDAAHRSLHALRAHTLRPWLHALPLRGLQDRATADLVLGQRGHVDAAWVLLSCQSVDLRPIPCQCICTSLVFGDDLGRAKTRSGPQEHGCLWGRSGQALGNGDNSPEVELRHPGRVLQFRVRRDFEAILITTKIRGKIDTAIGRRIGSTHTPLERLHVDRREGINVDEQPVAAQHSGFRPLAAERRPIHLNRKVEQRRRGLFAR